MSVSARARSIKPDWRRNLSRGSPLAAKGNGRVQKACNLAFIAFDGPVTTSDAIEWAYPRAQGWRNDFNRAVRRALVSIGAQRIGHARTRGRPWLWAPPLI